MTQNQQRAAPTTGSACCICGHDTRGAEDHLLLDITADGNGPRQFLDAHTTHLNTALEK